MNFRGFGAARKSVPCIAFLFAGSLVLPGMGAAQPASIVESLKKDQFTVVTTTGGQRVEVIRLFDPLPKVPGRIAWLEADGIFKTATDDSFLRMSPATAEPTGRKPQKIKGLLKVSLPQMEFTRNFYATDKTSTFSFVEGATEIEVACAVVTDSGPPPPTYYVAFAWRIKKKDKIKESDSSVAKVLDGQEVPIPLSGSNLEEDYKISFYIEEVPVAPAPAPAAPAPVN